jgi:hypothetical protein
MGMILVIIVKPQRGLLHNNPLWEGYSGGVQTGKIVYKTNRGHGLHFTARRILYAVESDKPNGHKD